MNQIAGRLVWIDLEMTGLDSQQDSIIEIATIVTDTELEVVAEGPVLAIHHADEVLALLDGGLRGLRESEALFVVRKLTRAYWDGSGDELQREARVRAALGQPAGGDHG
jgi:oligoribonuclease (3'-5' exoribonuclease)